MKARLAYLDGSYHLLLCTGVIKKITMVEARGFLESFDSDLHYIGTSTWNYGQLTMDDYGGLTVASVTDDGYLLIQSADHLRMILSAKEIQYLSPKEYADIHGKQRTVVSRLCRESRIPGVKKRGNSWLIPANAPYPEDGRFGKHNAALNLE